MYQVKRHCNYGSNQWAVFNTETNQIVVAPPVEFEHPTLGMTTIGGVLFYARKRDAQAALDSWQIAR